MDGAKEARFLTEYWLLFLVDGSCYLVEADALLGHLAERGRRPIQEPVQYRWWIFH